MTQKLFFIIALSTFSIALQTSYVPTTGPLEMFDTRPYVQYAATLPIKRGVIMNTLLTNSQFTEELNAVKKFLNIPLSTTYLDITYQELMDKLTTTTNPQAITVIEALEKIIMHQYHYPAYITYSYRKNGSMFITGIQHPANITGKFDAIFEQVLQEINNLSYIASRHSIKSFLRMQSMIHSYKHWKRNLLVSTAATIASIGAIKFLYFKNK